MLPWTFLHRFLCRYVFCTYVFMSLKCTPLISGMLGNMVILYFAFWRSVRCFPQQLHHFRFSPRTVLRMQYLHILPHLVLPTLIVTLQGVKSAVLLICIFLMTSKTPFHVFLFQRHAVYWLALFQFDTN